MFQRAIVGDAATFQGGVTTMLNRLMSCGAALVLLALAATSAAQQTTSDRDLRNLPHSGGLSAEDRKRFDELKQEDATYDAAVVAEGELRQKLLRLPPLPDERNGLLGSWRQENGGQLGMLGSGAATGDDMVRELWETLQSNPNNLMPSRCVTTFGYGVTFAPSTYTSSAIDGSRPGGSIAYRSVEDQVIWVIPDNLKPMPFKITGPDRILLGIDGSCAMVRSGAPAAAANAATVPGNARMAAASPSALPAAGTAPQVAAVAPAPSRSTAVAAVTGSLLPQTLEDVDFRCDGKTLIMVKFCARGGPNADCSVCQLGEPKDRSADSCGLTTRAQLAERIGGCEEGKVVWANDGAATFAPAARR